MTLGFRLPKIGAARLLTEQLQTRAGLQTKACSPVPWVEIVT